MTPDMSFIDVWLEGERHDPLARLDDATPAAIAEAVAAAAALARRAYLEHDQDALRAAERALYLIHLRHRFGAPVEPLLAAVWGLLMRALLRRWLSLYDGPPEIDPTTMRARLIASVEELGAYNHPLLDRFDREGSAAYGVFVRNWYGSCHGFSQQLSALAQRTHGKTKLIVLENLEDEFDGVTHDTLRLRFIRAVGFEFDADAAVADQERVIESFALLNFRTALCALAEPAYALGSFYAVEANWPFECERHLRINRDRGIAPCALEYWSAHASVDSDHADEWMSALEGEYRDPVSCAKVLRGAVSQLLLRRRMYDAMATRVRAHNPTPEETRT